jgi:hypothetical protein
MARLILSDAARACNIARTTIQRAVKTGRLSLDAEHLVDTAELLRLGYQLDAAVLHAASQHPPGATQQNAAPQHSTLPQQGVAAQELQLVRQERDALQRERDLLTQQVDMLRSMQHTTQQQLTQAQQMLHEMQHRYDRLLDTPRPVPALSPQVAPNAPLGQSEAFPGDPRGAMRRRIVALLQDYPEGLTPAQIRDLLGVHRTFADTCLGMLRYGLVRRIGYGRYVAAEPSQHDQP